MKDNRDPWDEAFGLLEETSSPARLAALLYQYLSFLPDKTSGKISLPTNAVRRLADVLTPKLWNEKVTVVREPMKPREQKAALSDERIAHEMLELVASGEAIEEAKKIAAKKLGVSEETVRDAWLKFRVLPVFQLAIATGRRRKRKSSGLAK